jgi:hypothetical protein
MEDSNLPPEDLDPKTDDLYRIVNPKLSHLLKMTQGTILEIVGTFVNYCVEKGLVSSDQKLFLLRLDPYMHSIFSLDQFEIQNTKEIFKNHLRRIMPQKGIKKPKLQET